MSVFFLPHKNSPLYICIAHKKNIIMPKQFIKDNYSPFIIQKMFRSEGFDFSVGNPSEHDSNYFEEDTRGHSNDFSH